MTSRLPLELITVNTGKYDYRELLQEHDVPMLVLQCDQDRRVNRHLDSSLELFQHLPGCEVVKLQRTGHFANLERPAVFNEAFLDFLAGHQEPKIKSSPAGEIDHHRGHRPTRISA